MSQDNVFPFELASKNGGYEITGGLTKREYFAGCALQGLIVKGGWPHSRGLAKAAVHHADLLLEELNKPKP